MASEQKKPVLRFKDLVTASGLDRLANAVQASNEQVADIHALAARYLANHPSLADLPIGKTTSGGFYDFRNNRLALGSGDPDVFSHEVEHAIRLKDAPGFYKNLLGLSKKMVLLNNVAAVPASMAIAKLIKDEKLREKALLGSAALGTLAAAPNLFEEAVASARALGKSNDRLRTALKLSPAFGAHLLHDMTAPGLYYGFSGLGKD